MKNILRFGINGNMLKTIAIIVMVIDHIGFYFEPFLNINIMIVCRYIGRMAMPIFTYLIVQGFFHTKNFKNYILRLFVWACITQLAITGLMIVNLKYVQHYTAASYAYTTLNVLFSYVVGLGTLKIIHEESLIKKWDYHKNVSLKVVLILLILITCVFLPIDYNIDIPVLTILFYFIEKLKITFMINTQSIRNKINKFIKFNENMFIHIIYIFLIFLAILLVTLYFNKMLYAVLAIIPIAMYNGERGKKSKILKYFFYCFFPIQHVVIYSLAMLIMLT